ncbi:hypothetical protein [Martelella mediterranea]|nr:hypothetical protein [Martelella mediterranea]
MSFSPLVRLSAVFGLLMLSACSSFSFLPGSKPSIPTPIAANPAAIRIAVLAPEAFRLEEGDLDLTVYQNGGSNEISHDYTLVSVDPSEAKAAIAKFRKPGQVLHLYRLAPSDALALRDQQQEMAAARERGKAKPGFSVDLDKACWDGPVYAPGVPLDVLIEAGGEEGFHPLLSDIDIFALLNRPEESRLKPCS